MTIFILVGDDVLLFTRSKRPLSFMHLPIYTYLEYIKTKFMLYHTIPSVGNPRHRIWIKKMQKKRTHR